jgi:hypothetical protein
MTLTGPERRRLGISMLTVFHQRGKDEADLLNILSSDQQPWDVALGLVSVADQLLELAADGIGVPPESLLQTLGEIAAKE